MQRRSVADAAAKGGTPTITARHKIHPFGETQTFDGFIKFSTGCLRVFRGFRSNCTLIEFERSGECKAKA